MPRLRSSLVAALALPAFASIVAAAPTTSPAPAASQPLYDPQALPSGALGDAIRLGHDIIDDTKKYVPKNVGAAMSCSACHIGAGTVARGGSFVGVYARFPQWNKRARRVIALQDRLAECFLYSMNGTPPAYSSKEMIAMTAYIAYLSRNVPTGAAQTEAESFAVPVPSSSPDAAHGAALYGQKCASCHQANGAGIEGAIPPLWGPRSFNDKAGMSQIARMTGFIRYNMPKNDPGSLSASDAYDIAGWVLAHARPRFDPSRIVAQPPQRADFF